MMYLLTEQEHAQIVDAAESNAEYTEAEYLERREFWGEALDYRWKNLQVASEQAKATLAMLKAMKPVEPCGHTSTSWLSNPHAGHFSAQKTDCFNVPLYAKEQQ